MKIDSHIHLNNNKFKNISLSFSSLSSELEKSKIDRAVVIHMIHEPWSLTEFSKEVNKYEKFLAIINIDPSKPDALDLTKTAIQEYGYKGVKLHPRLQQYDLNDKRVYQYIKSIAQFNIPIIIDAFPDGTYLMNGFSPLKYANLAKAFPNVNFVWAHMGGFMAIEFMLLTKRLKNVYMDISYSFLYFKDSSLLKDFIYCMKSLKFERVFYGSDYPDRSIHETLSLTEELLNKFDINAKDLNKLFFENAKKFWFNDK